MVLKQITEVGQEAGSAITFVQTEINDWSLPKAYPSCSSVVCNTVRINWEKGETTVTLPVVNAPRTPAALFDGAS